MNREKIKKALRIAVNVGCGFEGDAEDAASLMTRRMTMCHFRRMR